MQRALVMTVIGPDKPGLVESVSSIVAEHGGNWLESRMSRLGGYFAGILRVEVPAENQTRLTQALRNLRASRGLEVVVHSDSAAESGEGGRMQRLEIVGQDRPGIIRHIAQALAQRGVNVEDLSSETTSAAMSGETLFRAAASVRLPPSCDTAGLREDLERIASDLIVDINFSEETGRDDGLA